MESVLVPLFFFCLKYWRGFISNGDACCFLASNFAVFKKTWTPHSPIPIDHKLSWGSRNILIENGIMDILVTRDNKFGRLDWESVNFGHILPSIYDALVWKPDNDFHYFCSDWAKFVKNLWDWMEGEGEISKIGSAVENVLLHLFFCLRYDVVLFQWWYLQILKSPFFYPYPLLTMNTRRRHATGNMRLEAKITDNTLQNWYPLVFSHFEHF